MDHAVLVGPAASDAEYQHACGRVGRMGARGHAVTLLWREEDEKRHLQALARLGVDSAPELELEAVGGSYGSSRKGSGERATVGEVDVGLDPKIEERRRKEQEKRMQSGLTLEVRRVDNMDKIIILFINYYRKIAPTLTQHWLVLHSCQLE